MRYKYLMVSLMSIVFFSCKKEHAESYSTPPGPPVTTVLLKEITIPFLPSPYYHFEYDSTSRASFVSFASDFTRYDIFYANNKIKEMRNTIFFNKDRLQYHYDNIGRVSNINYADSNGVIFTRVFFVYEGTKLAKLERERKSAADFILNKRMTFSYYADGNLMEVYTHRPLLNGVSELNTLDRFEEYDNKLNVDGFQLLHSEFFDHFTYLPELQLQKNNPQKIIHIGDDVNYRIEYSYEYGVNNAPTRKIGKGTWLNGPKTGETFDSDYFYSYY